MSLYNLLFGLNHLAPFYLAILGLSPDDVGRFRDCFLQRMDDGELRIVIYTRNGGGNRDDYEEVTKRLQEHTEYVTDFDDDFDCTYASYVFKVPEKFKEITRSLSERQDQTIDPGARFKELLDKLQAGNDDDPSVKHALEVGKTFLGPLFEELKAQE